MAEDILYRGFALYFYQMRIALLEEIRSGKRAYNVLFYFCLQIK